LSKILCVEGGGGCGFGFLCYSLLFVFFFGVVELGRGLIEGSKGGCFASGEWVFCNYVGLVAEGIGC